MSTLQQLQEQYDDLGKRIDAERKRLRTEALVTIKGLCTAYELTAIEIFAPEPSKGGQRQPSTVAPKYRDPATGATWTGRGKEPVWIRGQDRSAFTIDNS